MPGKISTSLAALLLATAAGAQQLAPACFERVYSDVHLAGHPAQVVWQIRLLVGDMVGPSERDARLEVVAANQGHARANDNQGRVMTQDLVCHEHGVRPQCRVECDGGSMTVTRLSPDNLTFRTAYLMVGEGGGCGGLMDLAEAPGQAVSYKLNRVAAAACFHLD